MGETAGNGGGIDLNETTSSLSILLNIIAYNGDSGIACKGDGGPAAVTLGSNLLFSNAGNDLGSDNGQCPASWAEGQIFTDPLFCDPAHDDYHLRSDSPALTDPAGPFGAYPAPGCGPK